MNTKAETKAARKKERQETNRYPRFAAKVKAATKATFSEHLFYPMLQWAVDQSAASRSKETNLEIDPRILTKVGAVRPHIGIYQKNGSPENRVGTGQMNNIQKTDFRVETTTWST